MPAVPSSLIEPIWEQFDLPIPPVIDQHPLGCLRPRVPDCVVFDTLVQILEDPEALAVLDFQTAQSWLSAHVEDGVARALGYVVRTELCAEPSQVSATVLLELYSDLASDTLLRDSESDRVVGGPERIAHALAGA